MLKLSPRETEVLSLYLREGNLAKVAQMLGVSINTVKTQRSNIMRKLCVKNSVELTLAAMRRGFVDLRARQGGAAKNNTSLLNPGGRSARTIND